MDHVLEDIPEYEFENEGVLFLPSHCDQGAITAGSPPAQRSDFIIDGDEGEDHLLPPHVILDETFGGTDYVPLEPLDAAAAANPPLDWHEVKRRAQGKNYALLNELSEFQRMICEAPDDEAWLRLIYEYKRRCNNIADEDYSIGRNIIDANTKMSKGLGYNWKTEGISFLPGVMAGIGDLCPYSSKACTASCLNWSGHAELAGRSETNLHIACRRRRSLLYYHQPDVFFMRLVTLITKHAHDAPPRKYVFRPNVYSDIAWETLKFFNPWARGEATLGDSITGDKDAKVQMYDYTKNPVRYGNFLMGRFPPKYHLTFSLNEINALYAFYALAHGGSVAVVFDTPVARAGFDPKPPGPLPTEFCGYRVIDGDLSDLRFLDREMFKIPEGKGFVIGLRLKGTEHREKYFKRLSRDVEDGFIFQEKRVYSVDKVIERSEEQRQKVQQARTARGLKGDARREYDAGFPETMIPMLYTWWKGRQS